MLIDGHTHAFLPEDLTVLRQRLELMDAHLASDDPHKWQLHGRGDLADLVRKSTRAGVDRLVLLPVANKKERVRELNCWAAEAAKEDARIIPFAMLHPLGDFEKELEIIVDLGMKGVKLHPFLQHYTLDHPRVDAMFRLLAEAGLPVLLDTMHVSGLLSAKPHLAWAAASFGFEGCLPHEVAALARAHPKVRLIAAHGGSLYGWDQIEPLWELDNIYFDLAYLNGLVPPARMVEIIRRKGPARVIYGSDALWREPAQFRAWFEDLPLTAGERQQIAAGTLCALLGCH